MPFLSKSQQKKCYALKAQGKAGSWDCKKWSKETNQKTLSKTKSKKR
jgi:hypothetical protein